MVTKMMSQKTIPEIHTSVWVAHLVGDKKTEYLHTKISAIDVVTQEKIVGIWRGTPYTE
jgi:hypothetical protein